MRTRPRRGKGDVMFDIGWTELMVIGIVALIVVGPKDLPKMFRTLGQFTAKARGMAREFQRAMDDAADSSGVKDVARDLRKATDTQGMGLDELNKMRNWDPLKDDGDGAKKKSGGKTVGGKAADDAAAKAEAEDDAAMARMADEMDKHKAAAATAAPKGETPSGDNTAQDKSKA
jgi:sec-independent protein translocase protein TatB